MEPCSAAAGVHTPGRSAPCEWGEQRVGQAGAAGQVLHSYAEPRGAVILWPPHAPVLQYVLKAHPCPSRPPRRAAGLQIFMFRLDDGGAPVLERLSGCLAWLLAMGFSRGEVSGVWRTQLRMFRLPAELLQRNLASLRSRVPLSAEQQRRFVASSGALLGTDYEALLAKVRGLGMLGAQCAGGSV